MYLLAMLFTAYHYAFCYLCLATSFYYVLIIIVCIYLLLLTNKYILILSFYDLC
jgi:hypothetical protein